MKEEIADWTINDCTYTITLCCARNAESRLLHFYPQAVLDVVVKMKRLAKLLNLFAETLPVYI